MRLKSELYAPQTGLGGRGLGGWGKFESLTLTCMYAVHFQHCSETTELKVVKLAFTLHTTLAQEFNASSLPIDLGSLSKPENTCNGQTVLIILSGIKKIYFFIKLAPGKFG